MPDEMLHNAAVFNPLLQHQSARHAVYQASAWPESCRPCAHVQRMSMESHHRLRIIEDSISTVLISALPDIQHLHMLRGFKLTLAMCTALRHHTVDLRNDQVCSITLTLATN